MDKITHEVRLANWADIIKRCQERPEGQSAKQWIADNGINEKTYYYWQRRVRMELFEKAVSFMNFAMIYTNNSQSAIKTRKIAALSHFFN